MKLIVALIVFICIISGSVLAETISTKGRVVDQSGNAISGVYVYAVLDSWVPYSNQRDAVIKFKTKSGKDGSFNISIPKHRGIRSRYYFIIYKPDKWFGWVSGAGDYGLPDNWSKPEPDEYKIVVLPLTTHEGTVTDNDNKPIKDVDVKILYMKSKYDNLSITPGIRDLIIKPKKIITDKNGRYKIDEIPDGTFIFKRAFKPGYTQYGYSETNLPMRNNAASISMKITDKEGNPVSDARLVVTIGDFDYESKGIYTIEGLPPGGTHILSIISSDGISKYVTLNDLKSGVNTVLLDLILPDSVWVTGRLLDADTGKPVKGGVVCVCYPKYPASDWYAVSEPTDEDGNYMVRSYPGEGLVFYRGLNPLYLSEGTKDLAPISIPESGLKNYDIKIKKSDTVKGKIIDKDGKPLANMMVMLRGIWGEANVLTKTDGSFEVAVPSYKDYRNMPSEQNILNSSNTVTLTTRDKKWRSGAVVLLNHADIFKTPIKVTALPVKSVDIIIKDKNGNPLKGAMVSVFDKWETYRIPVYTDDNGKAVYPYVFDGGAYSILVALDGYCRDSAPIELPTAGSSEWKDSIEVILQKTAAK